MGKKDLELKLPVIDLFSCDTVATANSIHQNYSQWKRSMEIALTSKLKLGFVDGSYVKPAANSTLLIHWMRCINMACKDTGFFYLINHGIENELIQKAFEESRIFFSLSLEEKMKLGWKENKGYTPLCSERLDTSLPSKGDLKESIYIGSLEDDKSHLNQWPSPEILPSWRFTMERYYEKVRDAGRRLISLIALALDLEEDFFVKDGPLDPFLRLLHYPGAQGPLDEMVLGASAHSDYGMMTLLVSDGVPGLHVCREKSKQPQVWEDVHQISGAFVVNIGDLMERWTNCLYRSTLHRVILTGQERYSMAFFLNPFPDSVVSP